MEEQWKKDVDQWKTAADLLGETQMAVNELRRQANEWQERYRGAQMRNDLLSQQLAETCAVVEEQKSRLAEANAMVKKQENRLEEVLSSRSWKITKPLRTASGALRRQSKREE